LAQAHLRISSLYVLTFQPRSYSKASLTFFMASSRLIAALSACFALVPVVDAGRFLPPKKISTSDAERQMLEQLSGTFRRADGQARLEEFETALVPMFRALPKDADGTVNHAVVRYALHRLFMQRRSWFIRGLDPKSDSSAQAPDASMNFSLNSVPVLPSLLQGSIERMHASKGMSLREMAVLAAALDDIAHREALSKLDMSYDVLNLTKGQLLDNRMFNEVVTTYMTIYFLGTNYKTWTSNEILRSEKNFVKSKRWAEIHRWVESVQKSIGYGDNAPHRRPRDPLHLVEVLGDEIWKFNDVDCKSLKSALLELEGRQPGRVRLSDFYAKGKNGVFAFTEKLEYLRTLGALDEFNASDPQVIVPNYVSSMPQCLQSSSLYSVCCRNECEGLMAKVEAVVEAPEASVGKVAAVVSGISSDTVHAPRRLAPSLQSRLQQIAEFHGGMVPLHGRLFAQWMSHAFPRECPYPHKAGVASPQTPDEWMQVTGHADTEASDAEMKRHIKSDGKQQCTSKGCKDEQEELPWNHHEELLSENPFEKRSSTPRRRKKEEVQSNSSAALVCFVLFAGMAAFALRLMMAAGINIPLKGKDV